MEPAPFFGPGDRTPAGCLVFGLHLVFDEACEDHSPGAWMMWDFSGRAASGDSTSNWDHIWMIYLVIYIYIYTYISCMIQYIYIYDIYYDI